MFGDVNLVTIFITGLLTGGLTCIAVQGGLLTATLAQREQEKLEEAHEKSGKALPIISFLISKLIAYTIFGAFLGWLGSLVQISLQAHVILQIAVVIFMVGTAFNLLNVHPIFRYFVIQPPRFLTKFVRKQSKRKDIFAPALLGASTVFIPCGTTQAMMALAIATGQPFVGAAILFSFVLGTLPVFFLLGYFTMRVGDFLKDKFMKVAAGFLILLALFNIDGALALTGTPFTLSNGLRNLFCIVSYCQRDFGALPVSEQSIMITPTGYTPSLFTVRAGSEVTIHLTNNNTIGCLQAFTIPSLNVQKVVSPHQTEVFTFTAPTKPGNISFMCSMGMYPGIIKVI